MSFDVRKVRDDHGQQVRRHARRFGKLSEKPIRIVRGFFLPQLDAVANGGGTARMSNRDAPSGLHLRLVEAGHHATSADGLHLCCGEVAEYQSSFTVVNISHLPRIASRVCVLREVHATEDSRRNGTRIGQLKRPASKASSDIRTLSK